MSFDLSKIILDRSKQTDTPSLKILKILIGRKTEWTDRIRQRLTIFLRKNTIFEKKNDLTQSFEIYEQKCMSMRWYDFQIKNIKPKIPKNKISCNLHQIQAHPFVFSLGFNGSNWTDYQGVDKSSPWKP